MGFGQIPCIWALDTGLYTTQSLRFFSVKTLELQLPKVGVTYVLGALGVRKTQPKSLGGDVLRLPPWCSAPVPGAAPSGAAGVMAVLWQLV